MARARRAVAIAAVAAVIATACTGGGEEERKSKFDDALRGGTLRVGIPEFSFLSTLTTGVGLDPQKDYWPDSWELFRCCLLRTLVSYRGLPTEQGGAQARPDLAAAMPSVSPDGLTWTFRLKPRLHYAPPFEEREIVAQDFVRAFEREADPKVAAGYSYYFSIVEGLDEFAAGKAEAISGLETPDERTLVIRLDQPSGDLADRLAMAAAAPIPQGAADAHPRDYGRFLAASGPYMIEGSEDAPAPPAAPFSGYVPKESITLVRNPSWRPRTDDLRPAYPDRIEIALGGSVDEVAERVDDGALDLMLHTAPPPQLPGSLFDKYVSEPILRERLLSGTRDFLRYVSMNLALPPFDDIHVRKAMNYAIDKDALVRIHGGRAGGRIIGHVALDSLEANLLRNYDPYGPFHGGNVTAARREMRASRYDGDGDGVCDDAVCSDVLALTFDDGVFPRIARAVKADLAEIGVNLRIELLPAPDLFGRLEDPTQKVPMAISISWGKDMLNATHIFDVLFSRASLGENNFSLVGATRAQLSSWGYDVRSVPSVEDRIAACRRLVGAPQVQCWAEVDQFLMEEVVPQVPYLVETNTTILSERVGAASFDQFASLPAVDRVALRR